MSGSGLEKSDFFPKPPSRILEGTVDPLSGDVRVEFASVRIMYCYIVVRRCLTYSVKLLVGSSCCIWILNGHSLSLLWSRLNRLLFA